MGIARESMDLGIFTRTYRRPTIGSVFQAIHDAGLTSSALTLSCAGIEEMPESIEEATLAGIQDAADTAWVTIDCLSGTFNMAHPDPAIRADGLRRFATIVQAAKSLGAPAINLCSGTRNTDHMWRWHDGNDDPSAWQDMVETMAVALTLAEEHGLDLLVEPETGNVINSPQRARRLIDEMASPRLKIIVDVANMTDPGDEARIPAAMETTFALLADRFAMIHGKDRRADGTVIPAGKGVVPWAHLLDRLDEIGFTGPLIIHGVDEQGADVAIDHFRSLGIEH